MQISFRKCLIFYQMSSMERQNELQKITVIFLFFGGFCMEIINKQLKIGLDKVLEIFGKKILEKNF